MAPPDDSPSARGTLDVQSVAVDRDAEVPIGVQLAWALRTRIGEGTFVPGQRLPALRDLADSVGVNVNTVRAVYQSLEREGLVVSQQGAGTFVAASPPSGAQVGVIAANAVREARASGVDPREVAAALYVSGGSAPQPSAAHSADRSEAAKRRILRRQIDSLERALGEIEAEHPGVAPRVSGSRRGVGPTLLSAHELEQTRTQLVRRLAAVQVAIDEQTKVERSAASAKSASRSGRTEAGQAKASKPKSPPRARGAIRPAPAGT